MARRICEILSSVRYRMPAIYNRDVLHTGWKQRIESALKNSGNIIWKRNKFYEIYDGKNKILKIVLNDKNSHNLLRCEAYEIYAIVILKSVLYDEKIDIIVVMGGRKNIMDDEHMIISSRQTSDYLPLPFFKKKKKNKLIYRNMLLQDFCMHFSIILQKE